MAFVTPTDIANMAVSHVGGNSQIENLTSDKSEEARQCRIWYDPSREQVLEAHDWKFARHRIGLALHGVAISETSTDPWAGVWSFRYQYPADCVAVRKIQNSNAPPDDADPFDVELSPDADEKTVLTNVEDAVAVYTRNVTDTSLFSMSFVQAHSHLLASYIAWSITGKRKVQSNQFAAYRLALPTAAAMNANEAVDAPPRDVDWVRDRS